MRKRYLIISGFDSIFPTSIHHFYRWVLKKHFQAMKHAQLSSSRLSWVYAIIDEN